MLSGQQFGVFKYKSVLQKLGILLHLLPVGHRIFLFLFLQISYDTQHVILFRHRLDAAVYCW